MIFAAKLREECVVKYHVFPLWVKKNSPETFSEIHAMLWLLQVRTFNLT